ncbi:hypothetical protein EFV37_29320 [Mesorhizobium loti]|uniref:Uncharacterized protein n=1 Tax=Mesorhizobium jarvisii TaxID=1777867 RepID=A0A6M7TLJ4_9HYPH|nr:MULTISPECIES: hypothetical protein [Mesorhizobium]OBQ68940.1 hypothetical protein A9K72_12175 [Mesorhizobium loti]QKC65904.1 hypothetical protein EB229_29310 [Mesorhizobium jarvisii]QKD11818.1 hypothetical protein EFV37_29320 [Mesorhizobium loti]RJT37925.1 hypothetical protein D3242_01365 [Mesorhizobium jarvisii]
MTTWALIIVIGGFTGISDVKQTQMTEAQCKRTVIELKLYKDHIGAGCFGPEGQKFTFDDVGEAK